MTARPMTDWLAHEQARAERDYLAARFLAARWPDSRTVGLSSNAMLWQALSGEREPRDWPQDRSDLERCENTYAQAPEHLKPRMLQTLERFREHIA